MNKNKIKKIGYSLLSLLILVLPLVMVQTAGAQWTTDTASESDLPSATIWNIIRALMLWMLGILGFIAIIGFVISGILYLTASGDEDRMSQAKNAMMYSIIGVIVGLMGFVIVLAVDNWLDAGDQF